MIQTKPLKLESPSKRLRSVIYHQWLRIEDKDITSEDFYNERMEEIINKEKEKL